MYTPARPACESAGCGWAVYIGNVCMAEHDILSSGHDVQRFLRGGNMVCGPCQDFCQAVKVYGLNQIVERIEVKCLPIKVFAGCQKDQKRIFVQPANAACSVYTVLTGQIYIKQKYIKLLLPVFHIEQQRFRAGIFCKITEYLCLAQQVVQMCHIFVIVFTYCNMNHINFLS